MKHTNEHMRYLFALVLLSVAVLTSHAQLSVTVRPEIATNTPGTLTTFEIDYRWASTTQDVAGAKIEIPLPDPLANDAAADVSMGTTPHIAGTLWSFANDKATYTFVNPLPAGSSGTLTFKIRYPQDGTITNGTTTPFTATFSATNQPSVSDTSQLIATGTTNTVTLTKTRLTTQGKYGPDQVIPYRIRASAPANGLDVNPFVLVDRLQAGAVFVSASPSGVYDPATHTVTWPARIIESGANVDTTVNVIFPSSNGFAVGSQIINWAESTNTVLYTTTPVVRFSAVTNILDAASISMANQTKQDAGFNGLFGDSFTWEVDFIQRGSVTSDTVTVTDTFPPALVPTAFNPGYGLYSPTIVSMAYRTLSNAVWTAVAGSPLYVTNNAEATTKTINVSSFGLPAGDIVTDFRWVYTNVPPVADFDSSSATGPTTTGYLTSVDRNGQSVASDALITNTATIVMASAGLASVTNTVTDPVQLTQPRASIDLGKAVNAGANPAYPGTTNTWRLTVANSSTATANLFNPVIADLLPATLEYVPNSVVKSGSGYTNFTVTATANYRGTGRTHLRIALLGSQTPNQTANLDFQAVVRANTVGGSIQNAVSLLSHDSPVVVLVDGLVTDSNDLDNDGNTTEQFSTTSANLTVNSTAAVSSRKAIQGYPDAAFYPLEGESYLGGPMAYRLRVQNIGNIALTNIVVVDILPHVGDTGVIVTNELRGSQWTPFLTGPVSGPAGVTVFYSQSYNPYRPELLPGGPAGAVDDWTSVPPTDIRAVKSLKFAFKNTVLNPADTVELSWPMQIPLNAPTNTYAVNSFGFVATRQDTGAPLLSTEPLSVRIKAGPPMPVNIGDTVWGDANTNGVQDVGEAGLDGVRVELYRDGGDGQAGSADDVFVSFVLTGVNTNGASGFYQFSHQSPGNYFVRVLPTVGYSISPADQGGNDTLDSDISPSSGYTALIVTYSGDRIWTVDAGLYYTGYGTVGNYVWNDRNGDGLQNEGSADGLNGVRVELHSVAGSVTNLVDAATTGYDSFGNPGYYSFPYVSPADYVLRFVAPSNFTFTTRGPTGSSDSTDSDPNASTGFTELFSVSLGENDPSWDAGLRPPSGTLSLGNVVWYDSDGDRVFDRFSGEYGINGVPLSLYRDVNDDNVLTPGVDPLYGSTVTATFGGEDGRYLFSGLPAGKYFVIVDSQAFAEGKALYGKISTPGQQNADNNIDHDDNGAAVSNYVASTRITLAAGTEPAYGTDSGEDASTDSNLTLDFGFLYATNLVAVGGTLFHDADNNGLQGAGEAVFSGTLVQLWSAGANGLRGGGDDVEISAGLSDGNGVYFFDELAPGRYYVTVPTPPATATSATVLAVGLDNGVDADSNALQPGGQGTAVYSPVFLLQPLAEPAGAGESGPGGSYDDALVCGDSNADLTQDLGFTSLEALWAIRGQVRDDYDIDGVLADPDLPVGGITVRLYTDPNGDGDPADGTLLQTTLTSTNGTYAFADLTNGRYVVEEVDPVGATSTRDAVGANDNRIPVTLNNADSVGNDFLDGIDPNGYFYHVLDGAIVPGGQIVVTGPGATTVFMDGSSGQYRFVTDGTAGYYTIAVTPPPGYIIDPSRPPAGSSFDPSGGPDPTRLGAGESTSTQGRLAVFSAAGNPYYYTFFLSPGSPIVLNNNFPLMKPNRLGDRVWEDLNGNGAQDAGEGGLSNVTVRLLDVDLNVITSTVTDAQGVYFFDNPGTANRIVQVVRPAGYLFTTRDTSVTNDMADSDVEIDTGYAPSMAVASGQTNLTVDAGFYAAASIAGFVRIDLNGNGTAEAGDTNGIAGVTVQLLDAGSNVVATATTAADGSYSFTNLRPGSYTVRETDPGGWYSTLDITAPNDNLIPVTLAIGQNSAGNNFYDAQRVALGNFVWEDLNGNGQQDTGAETNGLSNVVVRLYDNGGSVVGVTTSAVNGVYAFTNLVAGSYTVSFTPPANYLSTTSNVGNDALDSDPLAGTNRTDTVTLASGQTDNTVDAGFYLAASIAGFVRIDLNGNGVAEAGDTNGIAGVTVQLLDASSNVVATASTAADGSYSFTNLRPGSYTVRETDPGGWYSTLDVTAPNDNLVPVTLAIGQNSTGNNFHDAQRAAFGDRVWNDLDGDGVQEAFEPGISGIRVYVDSDGSGTYNPGEPMATTAGDGSYQIGSLLAGSYTARLDVATLPAGMIQTYDLNGGLDHSASVTLLSNQTRNDVDFGYRSPAVYQIRGQVRDDYDLDGAFSDPDLPVGGVLVLLYSDPNGDGTNTDGVVIGTVRTTADGHYLFTNVLSGAYVVVEDDPKYSVSTADTSGNRYDNMIPVVIVNADSIDNDFLDAVDPTGYLYDVTDGRIVPGGSVSVTGAGAQVLMDGSSGQYMFISSNSVETTFTIAVTPPPGYMIDTTRPAQPGSFDPTGGANPTVLGSYESALSPGYLVNYSAASNTYYYTFTLAPGDPPVINNNFPLVRPAALGDRVWEDLDGDGVQDAGEPGMTNITVRLLDASSNVVHTTITDVNGAYSFTNLFPATYLVQVVPPAQYILTLANTSATNDLSDSDMDASGLTQPFALAAGVTDLSWDAGLTLPARIYGYAFLDLNTNLVRTVMVDYPIANMTVTLWRAGMQVASTLTAADGTGRYEFTNLTAGAYTVRFGGDTNMLEAVPGTGPSVTDPERNRAAVDGNGTIAISVSVAPGEGVTTATEPRNAGFIRPERPLSEFVSIRAYAASDGMRVEFTTAGEAGYGMITLWVWLDGAWVGLGSTPSMGFGSNTYSFNAPGLEAGKSYYLKVEDEVGYLYDLYDVTVQPFAMEMQLMERAGVRLTWNSIPGRTYKVYTTKRLGDVWTFVETVWADSDYASLEVTTDPQDRQRFFKIVMVRDEVIE